MIPFELCVARCQHSDQGRALVFASCSPDHFNGRRGDTLSCPTCRFAKRRVSISSQDPNSQDDVATISRDPNLLRQVVSPPILFQGENIVELASNGAKTE